MPMLKMSDLDLTNKRVLIREDLNVPIEKGQITSATRIKAILPTLNIALKQQAKVILMSHLGRPKEGEFDPDFSLAPVAHYLTGLLDQPVKLIQSINEVREQKPGEVILLENSRFWVGEKENSPELGRKIANLCDIFVMDAFATAHRKEASTYRVAEYAPIACAGPLLCSEVEALQRILKDPARPVIAIVGGSKVSTKLSILKNVLNLVDCLILGGGIANTFLAAEGYSVGRSLYEPDLIEEAKSMLTFAKNHDKQIPLPTDVVVANEFNKDAKALIKNIRDIKDELILDLGPKSMSVICDYIRKAKTILWNGPLGVFEWDQFGEGTKALANAIATSNAYSVAGGGDTLAAIEKYQLEDKISYISTGGGAFLEVLEGKKLPAIAILEERSQMNDVAVN